MARHGCVQALRDHPSRQRERPESDRALQELQRDTLERGEEEVDLNKRGLTPGDDDTGARERRAKRAQQGAITIIIVGGVIVMAFLAPLIVLWWRWALNI